MKSRAALILGAALVFLSLGDPALAAISPPPAPGPAIAPLLAHLRAPEPASSRTIATVQRPVRVVVGLRSGAGVARLRSLSGVRVFRVDRTLGFAVVLATPAARAALAEAPWARYVTRTRTLEPSSVADDTYFVTIDPATGLPYEWQFAAAHVDRALELAAGNPDFLIGIVDTGADVNQPDLAGKIVATNGDVTDTIGHGTFVSALAGGAVGDGSGIAGFGGASRLVVARSELTEDALASSIRFATDQGVRVINMSWGGPEESGPIADAVTYAAEKGVLLVAAAGNEATTAPLYPAAYLQEPYSNGGPSIGLAVGASDQNGARPFWSNYGTGLSLLAPGAWSSDTCPELGVFSAVATNQTTHWDEGPCLNNTAGPGSTRWGYAQGTSFSSPEVAGAAALAWSVNPDLKNFQVAEIMKQSAARPAGTGWTPDAGWGVLDVAAAVELASRYDSVAPTAELTVPGPVSADPAPEVSWSGSDAGFAGNPASGISTYELFYSEDGGKLKPWLSSGKARGARFEGQIGHRYAFVLRVSDASGNVTGLRPVRVSLRPTKTKIVLRSRPGSVRARRTFHLVGRVETLTPGGESALASAGPLEVVATRVGAAGKLLLGRGKMDATGRFDLVVVAPEAGRYELVVKLPRSRRVIGARSAELTLVSE